MRNAVTWDGHVLRELHFKFTIVILNSVLLTPLKLKVCFGPAMAVSPFRDIAVRVLDK